jgi:hypothetical protein
MPILAIMEPTQIIMGNVSFIMCAQHVHSPSPHMRVGLSVLPRLKGVSEMERIKERTLLGLGLPNDTNEKIKCFFRFFYFLFYLFTVIN